EIAPGNNRRKFIIAAGSLALLAAGAGAWFAVTKFGHGHPSAGAGLLDPTFKPGTETDHEIRIVAPQPDGKILVGGMFTKIEASPRRALARLNADGSIDPLFDPHLNGDVHSLALQSDGKILVGGEFGRVNGDPHRCIVRLNPYGTVDVDFSGTAGAS